MTEQPAQENPLDTPDLETGRWLFAQPCEFVRGVVEMKGLPATALAEVAFAGRSNVGKSSLINALTGRKTLARTSNTPGRTKELNFFSLGAAGRPAIMLVDLPGYGYARETKSRVNEWTELVMSYLRGRAPLRRVDITQEWPSDLDFVARERFTPTFVLIEDGREIDRLRGYPGDEFFWYLLDQMIAKLPQETSN